jgi:hypothetical protein
MQARAAARAEAQRQAINAQDDQTCRGYGVQPGSDGYVACRMNIANNRSQQQQVNAIVQQRNSEALMATGAYLMTNGR